MVLCQWRWTHLNVAITVPVCIIFLCNKACMIIHLLVKCRSEGPAQVFLLVLTWLITAFGHMSRTDWKKIVLAYDNMCHLNNLRVAQSPLPLPGKLKFIWNDIHKIIDDLHLKNHKDPRCAQNYSSAGLRDDIPDMNTMSCEQTFAWLSRFKKILCAMPKVHHHFYLHRLTKQRNKYISFCYSHHRRPLQPKIS